MSGFDDNEHMDDLPDDDRAGGVCSESFEDQERRFHEIFGDYEPDKPPPTTPGYEDKPHNCPALKKWNAEQLRAEQERTRKQLKRERERKEQEDEEASRDGDFQIDAEINNTIIDDPDLIEDIKPWGQTRWGEFYPTAEEHLPTLKQLRALYGDWLDAWTHYKGDPCIHCGHTTKRLYGGACIHCTPPPTRSTILEERERGSKGRHIMRPWRRKARALLIAGWSRNDIARELRVGRGAVGQERVIFFVEAVKAGDVEAALILAPEMSRRGGRKLRAVERMKRLKEKKMAEPLLKPRGDIDE